MARAESAGIATSSHRRTSPHSARRSCANWWCHRRQWANGYRVARSSRVNACPRSTCAGTS